MRAPDESTPHRFADRVSWRAISGPLFRKYVALFIAVVCVALITNGAFEVYFSYQEHKAALIRIQREQAAAAAKEIDQFIEGIKSQVGWTTQLPWSAGTIEARRFDGLRLLAAGAGDHRACAARRARQGAAARLAARDGRGGKLGPTTPRTRNSPRRWRKKVYYGPVYFRRESEPYMTLALAGTRRDAGVSVAEVNLKLIWEVVSQIKVGERGHAYVIDAQGRLIAHPDISLVLRNTDMTRLAQVQAARAAASGEAEEPVQEAEDIQGRKVLTAYAPVTAPGWIVFVELPSGEAYAPLFESIQRSGLLLLLGLALAVLSGMFLARRMVVPIQALRRAPSASARAISASASRSRPATSSKALADQFNDMAGKLAGVLRRPRKEGRGPHPRAVRVAGAADRDRRGAAGHLAARLASLKPVFDTMLENAVRASATPSSATLCPLRGRRIPACRAA